MTITTEQLMQDAIAGRVQLAITAPESWSRARSLSELKRSWPAVRDAAREATLQAQLAAFTVASGSVAGLRAALRHAGGVAVAEAGELAPLPADPHTGNWRQQTADAFAAERAADDYATRAAEPIQFAAARQRRKHRAASHRHRTQAAS